MAESKVLAGGWTSSRTRARVRWRRALVHNGVAYLFLLPALVVYALFAWFPIIKEFMVSFQNYDLLTGGHWVGWANYTFVLTDPNFVTIWLNTLEFTAIALVLGFAFPIVLSLAVNEMRHAKSYFRVAFYLPVILPPLVVAFLWGWFFDVDNGLFNAILRGLGLAGLQWIQSTQQAMPSLVLMATWSGAGGTMLIYLAALQGIPAQLYDAAEIDGASVWQRLRYITLPQLRIILLIMLVLQIIATMQVFTEPFVLTAGGPNYATTTVLLQIYNDAFTSQNFGAASALGVMLFVVLVGLSLIYAWITRRAVRA